MRAMTQPLCNHRRLAAVVMDTLSSHQHNCSPYRNIRHQPVTFSIPQTKHHGRAPANASHIIESHSACGFDHFCRLVIIDGTSKTGAGKLIMPNLKLYCVGQLRAHANMLAFYKAKLKRSFFTLFSSVSKIVAKRHIRCCLKTAYRRVKHSRGREQGCLSFVNNCMCQ